MVAPVDDDAVQQVKKLDVKRLKPTLKDGWPHDKKKLEELTAES